MSLAPAGLISVLQHSLYWFQHKYQSNVKLKRLTDWQTDGLSGVSNNAALICQPASQKSVREIKSILIRHSNQLDSSRLNSTQLNSVQLGSPRLHWESKSCVRSVASGSWLKTKPPRALKLYIQMPHRALTPIEMNAMELCCPPPAQCRPLQSQTAATAMLRHFNVQFQLEFFFFGACGTGRVLGVVMSALFVGPISFNKKYFHKLWKCLNSVYGTHCICIDGQLQGRGGHIKRPLSGKKSGTNRSTAGAGDFTEQMPMRRGKLHNSNMPTPGYCAATEHLRITITWFKCCQCSCVRVFHFAQS